MFGKIHLQYWCSGFVPFRCPEVLSLSRTLFAFFNSSRCLRTHTSGFTSIFHMHYETPLIKFQVHTLSSLLSISNKCLFFLDFLIFCVFHASLWGCRLDESDFMPVSKPNVFYLYGENTLTALQSLWKIYQALSRFFSASLKL